MSTEPGTTHDPISPPTSTSLDRTPANQRVTQSQPRVNFQPPPFSRRNVCVWFRQVEAQFQIAGIDNEVLRYNYVLAVIDSDIAAEVSDIILQNPPSANPFTDLRNRLIYLFTDTEEKRIQKLLNELELGERRPSQLLREMRQLAGETSVPEEFLRRLFLQRLPVQVRYVLVKSQDNLTALADMADQIMDIAGNMSDRTSIQTVTNPTPVSSVQHNATISEITIDDRLAFLEKQIAVLTTEFNGRGRLRSRNRSSRQRFSLTSPKRSDSDSRECWYHTNFKELARKCVKPCSFRSRNPEN